MSAVSAPDSWYSGVPRRTIGPTLAGSAMVLLFVFGFGGWAYTAPIAGAVIASGTFVATGQNKIIQHLEGGIIRAIHVSEGDEVTAGQKLVSLDSTAPTANLERLRLRLAHLRATQARLKAEAEQLQTVTFPQDVLARKDDPNIAAIIAAQVQTFEARIASIESEVSSARRGIDSLQEQIRGGRMQVESIDRQLEIFEEEIKDKQDLLEQGLMRKPELLALERARAHLHGERGRVLGEIGDAEARIAKAQDEIVKVQNGSIQRAVEESQKVAADIDDIQEQMRAAQDILRRVDVTAPVNGVVVRLRYHTAGGVIEGGLPIMEILPLDDELIIEVTVRPQDIDVVDRGQVAVVRLTALRARVTPMISGEVIYVSADALSGDPAAMQQAPDAYVARIRLSATDVASLEGFEPTPGMPAEVYIKTDERTFLNYLMQPLQDSMQRAFREN